MFLSIYLINLILLLFVSRAIKANFPLAGPTTTAAESCYAHLSKNASQDNCLSLAEAEWNVSVTLNGTKSPSQCFAWTSSLRCIDELVCSLCTKKEIRDIHSWELSAYTNQTFCQLEEKGHIDWCAETAQQNASSSSHIAVIIVGVLLLTLIIMGGVAIILMINAPDKEDSTSDNDKLPSQKALHSDFNFASLLDSEKSQPKGASWFKSKVGAKSNGKLLGKSKIRQV